jgi:hypothetical protein
MTRKRSNTKEIEMSQKYYKTRSVTKDGEVVTENVYGLYSPFKEKVGYNLKYQSTFAKSYLGVSLPECFKDIELGRIYRISKMAYSDKNLLARRSNNKIVPITRDEIKEKLGMHRTKFVPFWKKLIDNNILKPIIFDDVVFFCLNPLYYNSTTYLPLYVFMAFQRELSDHLPPWAIEKYLEMGDENKIKKGENKDEKKV